MSFPFHRSVLCAVRGIFRCMRHERNLRIHTVAAGYVLFFSTCFELSRAEYAVLFLTCGAVLSAEVFNTAAERLCDFASPGFDRRIGAVKDLAAGAVLLCALAAVCVGTALFWRPERFPAVAAWFWETPPRLVVLLLTAAASVCFIILPGRGEKDGRPHYHNKGE